MQHYVRLVRGNAEHYCEHDIHGTYHGHVGRRAADVLARDTKRSHEGAKRNRRAHTKTRYGHGANEDPN